MAVTRKGKMLPVWWKVYPVGNPVENLYPAQTIRASRFVMLDLASPGIPVLNPALEYGVVSIPVLSPVIPELVQIRSALLR